MTEQRHQRWQAHAGIRELGTATGLTRMSPHLVKVGFAEMLRGVGVQRSQRRGYPLATPGAHRGE
ncbi:hypothetical protein, partial [Mycobacterium sp.]|uniref:hypothetical protein n=1 Tax=Mycobacterium sp. TaxID=1785 RepID=UPI0025D3731E